MASREYLMQLGKDLVAAPGPGNSGQIGGIQINNPSGSWLRVETVEQYVPPYTNGWQYPLIPMQANATVRFVDSPSGSKSVLQGSPPQVTLFDEQLPPSEGFTAGSLALTSGAAQDYLVRRVAFSQYAEPGGGLSSIIIPATGLGTRIVLLRLTCGAGIQQDVLGKHDTIRSVINVIWVYNNGIDNTIAVQALSPETPADSREYLPGSLFIRGIFVLRTRGITHEYGGRVRIDTEVQYYVENETSEL